MAADVDVDDDGDDAADGGDDGDNYNGNYSDDDENGNGDDDGHASILSVSATVEISDGNLPGRIEATHGPGQDGLMTESFEYVVAAYGIWSLVFLLYVPLIKRKVRTLQQNIEALRNEDTTNTN